MFLTRISISRPVFATMIMVAIMVFGLVGWRSLPIDRYPDIDFPVVAVLTAYSGASPETVENDVTKPIEDELNTLSGIEELTSTSSDGSSLVVVKFKLETDSALAAQDVRDRIAAVAPSLPDGVKTPLVMRHNPTETPVMSLAVSSASLDPGRLSRLTEDVVVPALTAITGVGSATVVGSVEDQVGVLIDPDRLRAYGLGVDDVVDALRQDNLLQPAGSVTTGTLVRAVQVNSESRTLEQLREVIVARQAGAAVRLGDVASIAASTSDPESLAFRDGQAALAIDVIKVDGANTVAVADDIERAIARLRGQGTIGDARIDVLINSADAIEANYATVRSTLVEGALLAVAIVFVFLNSWRSTVITALTLPISFLGTLAVISLL
ncbi:MAG TPA: efflux RND transporter permease subunit, partial [Thermomicrobiales bacterium]|nr:efflux RND transporter permease subunit [Thermomicrobiales bacterium]